VKHLVVQNENAHTYQPHSNVRAGSITTSEVDVRGLVQDLGTRISGEVRFDNGSRALYATDGSHYRQVPLGVVIPRNVDEVYSGSCHMPSVWSTHCDAWRRN
jgi:hypothetical protein